MKLIGLSQRICFIRTCLQVNRKELAQLLNVAESVIEALEEGQQELSTQMLETLVKEVNISADWLLFDVGEMFLASPQRIQSSNGAKTILAFNHTYSEKYLDGQIKVLEERFQKQTHLPLKQIRVLLTKILNSPVNTIETMGLPDEFSLGNWQALSYEEKTRYYQQLQYWMQEGQKEFFYHFHQLINLVGKPDA